jgi:cation transport ATPase
MEQSTLLTGSEAEQASTKVTVALDVMGMRCAGCVQTVEKRLLQQAGVFTAAVNLVTQTAMVEGESEIITPQRLADTLTQLGFPSQVRFQSGDQSLNQSAQTDLSFDPQIEKSDYGLAIALLLLLFSAVGQFRANGWAGPASSEHPLVSCRFSYSRALGAGLANSAGRLAGVTPSRTQHEHPN